MKKNKALAAAMASLVMTGMLGSCVPDNSKVSDDDINNNDDREIRPQENIPECVYGPPPADEFDPEENEPVDVYGPPIADEPEVEEFEPEENEPVAIYGPPAAYDEETAEEDR